MTREEAIYVLKNTAWLGSEELVGDVSEAIQMAVNALKRSETPNNSDVISRQAAIDAADRADYRGLTVEDVKKVTDEVIKELKKLPSMQIDLTHIIFETLTECGIYGEEATIKVVGTLKRLGRDDLLPPCAR